MGKYLVVIDMQKDFIDGSLGTAEARAIVPKVVDKVKAYTGKILTTKDTHTSGYLQTQEGRMLPVPHCIKGTEGHALCDALLALDVIREAPVFEKGSFGSLELAQYLQRRDTVEEVELVGLCTDICLISNALLIKTFLPETAVIVDAACCAGVTPEKHSAALETMRSCQIIVRQEEPAPAAF